MLSKEDNELLTRVGPDTPLGELFRRFWIPALLSKELPGPDCEPVRQMSKTPAQSVMRALAGFSQVDLTDVLPTIQTPALVIQGAADEMPLDRARRLEVLRTGGSSHVS